MDPQRIFLSALMVLVFITQGRDFQDYLNEKFCREGARAFHLNKSYILPFYFAIRISQSIPQWILLHAVLLNYNSSLDGHKFSAETQTPFILVNILCETASRP